MTTPGTDPEQEQEALRLLQEQQAVAFDRYREALQTRGLPEPLNPHRRVPRGR